jgi:copper transport protein
VVVSGVVRTMQLAGGGSHLFSTGYGRLLMLKAAGVAVLAYIATTNRQTVRSKLGSATQLTGRAAGRLRRAFSAELLVGVVIMGLTAWMLNSIPPGAAGAAATSKVKPVVAAAMKDNGIDVTVGAAPGVAGLNTIVITIRKPVTGLVDMDVQLLSPSPSGGGIDIPRVAGVLKGKGSMRVDGVPLDVPGTWRVVVTAIDTNGALPVVNGTFDVAPVGTVPGGSATDPTTPTQPGVVDPTATTSPAIVPSAAVSPNAATTVPATPTP